MQRCAHCQAWQFGPEWICHACLQFDPAWVEVFVGLIFSWERIWHPAHPALKDHGAYLAVVVELPHAGRVRMVGNLLGDPLQQVHIRASSGRVRASPGGFRSRTRCCSGAAGDGVVFDG